MKFWKSSFKNRSRSLPAGIFPILQQFVKKDSLRCLSLVGLVMAASLPIGSLSLFIGIVVSFFTATLGKCEWKNCSQNSTSAMLEQAGGD